MWEKKFPLGPSRLPRWVDPAPEQQHLSPLRAQKTHTSHTFIKKKHIYSYSGLILHPFPITSPVFQHVFAFPRVSSTVRRQTAAPVRMSSHDSHILMPCCVVCHSLSAVSVKYTMQPVERKPDTVD